VGFAGAFLWDLLNIIIINLILSGDNAVLIAMAVRSLPPHLRGKGFIIGAGAAVVLRIALTFIVAEVLGIPFVKLAGGAALLWIAVKLFVQGFPGGEEKEAATVFHAIKIMLIADLSMSLDNVIAVAGASHGNFLLMFFGLGLSIPFVTFTSGLLSMLMDRYPIIIYIGAAILGSVAAEMMIGDRALAGYITFPVAARYGFETFCAAGVIVVGRLALRRMITAEKRAESKIHSQGKIEE